MPINAQLTNTYSNYLTDIIKSFESFKSHIYDDGLGIPTIGYGYSLIYNNGGTWITRNLSDLNTIFSEIHTFTQDEKDALDRIANAKNESSSDASQQIII